MNENNIKCHNLYCNHFFFFGCILMYFTQNLCYNKKAVAYNHYRPLPGVIALIKFPSNNNASK